MTSRLARRLCVAGAALTLAAPGTALAHRGNDDHGNDRSGSRGASCNQLQRGSAPRNVTAEQTQALVAACTTRDAAVKAADDAFTAATKPAADAFRAVATSVATDASAAKTARRAACDADRSAQACVDARAAYRTTIRTLSDKLRTAKRAYRDAVRPAAQTRKDAVKAAKAAFRTSVAQILGQS
jgi:hypothetical protein